MKWINATNLEAWGRTMASEAKLPGLVADLISATASEIGTIRFPSGGKGRVRGFDGVLQSNEEALNVPLGGSVWEFKTSPEYKKYALKDFDKRTLETSATDQADLSLVLVTPFTWDSSNRKNKREDWERAREESSCWKEVKLLDGAQLEHWLDASPAVAARYARETIRTAPVVGVRSTDEFWTDFSARFNPQLIEKMLVAEREPMVERLVAGLMGTPQQINLVADSPEIATAFAVAAIRSAQPDVREFLEARTLIVDTAEAGRELVGRQNLIFFLRDDAARAPAPFAEAGPTLVPLGRRQRVTTDEMQLVRQSNHAIEQALVAMDLAEGKANTLARGCGGSLAALERQIPGGAATDPLWMRDARLLLPAFLAGGWDSANALDQDIVAKLAGTASYMAYDKKIRGFLQQSDAPLEREGAVYKVTAPIDAFIHAGHLIGDDDLETLRPALHRVFGELDPEPNPDDPIYMRERAPKHSDWLRDGLATTLLLIAAWESQARLSLGPGRGQTFANEVVGTLPGLGSDPRVMTSLESELPLLAEAAPEPFLSALERMLEGTGATILPIFDEVEGFAFPTSNHTGVLWALETLAWLPKWFRRACLILARLAEIDPGGRLVNRPINSLRDILLSWAPSTFADADARLALLDEVTAHYPEVGWRLLVQLLPNVTTHTSGTTRPLLRGSDASPQLPLTYGDVWAAERAIGQRAIALATGSSKRMRQLLAPMLGFTQEDREAGLRALDATLNQAEPADRTVLWDALHKELRHHRRFANADWALGEDVLIEFDRIAGAHEPYDPVRPASELFDHFAYEPEEAQQAERRAEVVRTLADQHGTGAILELIRRATMGHLVLRAIEDAGLRLNTVEELVRESFANEPQSSTTRSLFGLYRRLIGPRAGLALGAGLLKSGAGASDVAGLFYAWPTEPTTWGAVATLGEEAVEWYWKEIPSLWIEGERRTLLKLVIALVRRGRVLSALRSALNRLPEIPTCLLLYMFDKAVDEINAGTTTNGDSMLGYHMSEAFKELDERALSDIEIGKREYALLPLLEHDDRPLRLHRLMAEDPGMLHMIVRDVYRAENAPELEREASDQEQVRWRRAYKLLSKFALVPGLIDGNVDDAGTLNAWIDGIRALGHEHDRVNVTEMVIGNVLAHSPIDDVDAGWPHRFVRNVIEAGRSDMLERGFRTERFNMRGVTRRGPLDGGVLERDLAARYRRDAETAKAWPRTSALLSDMAEGWEKDAEREDLQARQWRMRS